MGLAISIAVSVLRRVYLVDSPGCANAYNSHKLTTRHRYNCDYIK